MKVLIPVLLVLSLLALPLTATAEVPKTINYQGLVTDKDTGQPLSGTVNLTFSLYTEADCADTLATPLWSEVHSGVGVTNGVYSVVLGGATPPTPLTLAFDQPYCLGVAIGGEEVLPRQKLTAVPYAFRAVTADGVSDTATISTQNQIVSTVTTGTAPLQVQSNTRVTNLNADMVDGQHAADFVLNAGDAMSGPLSISASSGSPLMSTLNTGSGSAATFQINNSLSSSPALYAETNGSGAAGSFNGNVVATGTVTATQFVGNGSSLTNVPAPRIVASVDMQFSENDRSGWTRIDALGDDQCHTNIPLGFAYTGFGIQTSLISISSNGVLFFGNACSTAFTNTALPSSISTYAMLFFFWDDLKDYGTGEYLEYQTLGSPGGRVFNLYFRDRLFLSDCGVDAINVMISIHEGSGLVKASYSALTNCANIRGSSATLGFQTPGGANATAFTVGYDSPVLDDNASRQTMSFHPPN